MFCHQCGERIPEQANFCNNCGEKVIKEETEVEENHTETTTSSMDEKESEILEHETPEKEVEEVDSLFSPPKPKRRLTVKLVFLLPLVSFLLVGGGVSGYYFFETEKNDQVLALQDSAEELATSGDYEKAATELEEAQTIRPTYAVLDQELEIITRAGIYHQGLLAIDEEIKARQFEQAEENLAGIKEQVKAETDEVFAVFSDRIAAKEVTITVGSIKQELNDLTTVSELAAQLERLESLPAEEAAAVENQIRTSMVKIAADQAETQLQEKQFAEAAATIEEGLQHVQEDEQLLSLKEKIELEQTAFEQAELARLEAAMEAAAQEDLQNRTGAVEVDSFEVEIDEFGDLYITGEVTNVATRTISSITIYYTVNDMDGNHLSDDSTSVFPYSLDPGETGSFEDVIFYVEENVEVEVENITWYIQ